MEALLAVAASTLFMRCFRLRRSFLAGGFTFPLRSTRCARSHGDNEVERFVASSSSYCVEHRREELSQTSHSQPGYASPTHLMMCRCLVLYLEQRSFNVLYHEQRKLSLLRRSAVHLPGRSSRTPVILEPAYIWIQSLSRSSTPRAIRTPEAQK
jgi:hypothetical protein